MIFLSQNFSKELDLYRAVTTYKRAEFLIPKEKIERINEIHYQILLCYFLGKKYYDVIQLFESSALYHANQKFPAYHDLLIIMYESYLELGESQKANYIMRIMKHYYPETADKLNISSALLDGDFDTLKKTDDLGTLKDPIVNLLENYEVNKKSVNKAQWANAILPGAGYLYVGQKQSALTAFLLNGLFIYATVHFYSKGNYPAAIIFGSFETGWYFGGIYGAGEAAKMYNERLYEKTAYSILDRQKLFPVLMLKWGF